MANKKDETAVKAGDVTVAEPQSTEPEIKQYKYIRFKSFKTETSRGRHLKGDQDDIPADEADQLIADGHAELVT